MAISLSSISRNTTLAPPRIVLHGPQGVGKSSWAASAPGAIFLLAEDGLGRLAVDHFPLLASYTDAMDAITALYQEEHEFHTAVVDTVDWFEPMIWEATCKANTWTNIEAPGYGKGYLAADGLWKSFLDGLNALRTERGMAIIVLAHSEIRAHNAPDTEPYDRYQIKLQKRASALLYEWADCVFFANFKTYTTTTERGFNKTVTRGVGAGERVMYTEERPAFLAKNRYGLPVELPLSWDAFANALARPANTAADAA